MINEFIKIWAKGQELYNKIGVIYNVSKSDMTGVFKPNDGSTELTVKLSFASSKIQIIPKDDTLVLVAYTSPTQAYVVQTEQFDEILYNDGINDGLINIVELTAKLNKLVTDINKELPKISAGIATGGGAYTPVLMTNFNKSDFEDDTIKH